MVSLRNLKDAAPVIAKQFSYLVNLSISTRLITSEWKNATVTLIFKSGARNDVNNDRVKDYGARCSSTILGFFNRT